MNPLYILCAPNGVHTNTLKTNTAWVLHITYNLCCTCTKGFTHHFGFLFIYFEAFILKALINESQLTTANDTQFINEFRAKLLKLDLEIENLTAKLLRRQLDTVFSAMPSLPDSDIFL